MLQLLGGMIKAEEPQNLPTQEKIGQLSITICYFFKVAFCRTEHKYRMFRILVSI